MAIVPLRFNERVVHQQGRAFEVLSLSCVAGERPSVDRSQEIARLWIANEGFRHDKRDRAVSVKRASRQVADESFRRDTNNQTDYGGGDGPILERGRSILIRSHADIELLGRRIVRLRRVRVPNDPPSAVGRYGAEIGNFHLEH